ncbi:MAG: serine hydrolase [Chloroflexota bacterium]
MALTAEQPVDAALTPAIETLLRRTFTADGTGAAVIAVRRGQTVFRAAYGRANLELVVPMQPDMVFRLASLTKQITAVAILMLAEQGRLALDADISSLLPGYPRREQPVTVHHLLTHTSGVNSFRNPDQARALPRRDLTMAEMLVQVAEAPPESAPGERFLYNNAGYNLLGAILQQASGQTYEQFLQEHIFGPLGMAQTYYEHPERIIPGRVTGYVPVPNVLQNVQFVNVSLAFAAGGLLSSVDDLARWHAALTANRLLRRETLELAFTSATLNDGTTVGYGYGWHLRSYEGHRITEHGGEFAGFHNHALRLPDDDVYVVVLTNQLPGVTPPSQLTMRIAALLLGKPYQDPVAITLPAATLARYCGTYQTRVGEVLTVGYDGDQLFLQPAGGSPQPIYPEAPTRFFFRDSFTRLTFREDPDGTTNSFQTQDRGGPVRDAVRSDG